MSLYRILGAWVLLFSLLAGACWGENKRADYQNQGLRDQDFQPFPGSIALYYGSGAEASAAELYQKGIDFAIQGKFSEAQTAFEQSWKIEKSETGSPFPSELALKVINDVRKGKVSPQAAIHFFKGTISEIDQGLQLSPGYAPLYFQRGMANFGKGEKGPAPADLTKSLQLDPGYWHAYYLRGVLYFLEKKYDLAIADFNETLRLNPRFVMAYYYRGLAYGKKDLNDPAIANFSKILEIEPHFVMAYFCRASFLARKNPKVNKSAAEQAIADLKKAVEEEPRLWQAHLLLAHVYESVGGDKKDIVMALKNFIQYAPPEEAERVGKARQNLQSLESNK